MPKPKAPPKRKAAPTARKVGGSAGKGAPKAAANPGRPSAKPRRPSAKPGKDAVKAAAGKAGREAQGPGRTPGSGRKPGTPNKRTLELLEALQAAGLDEQTHPIVMMYQVYTGQITMPVVVTRRTEDGIENEVEDVPLEPALRVKCMAEVAQYLEPKRKAVEITGADGTELVVRLVNLAELEPSGVGVAKP